MGEIIPRNRRKSTSSTESFISVATIRLEHLVVENAASTHQSEPNNDEPSDIIRVLAYWDGKNDNNADGTASIAGSTTSLPISVLTYASSVLSYEVPLFPIGIILTRRHHVLHELLASERAYASELALICELYVPLSLGYDVSPKSSLSHLTSNVSESEPNMQTEGTVSRRTSIASIASWSQASTHTITAASFLGTSEPPMTLDDHKIVFGDISELKQFVDVFVDELSISLGNIVKDGQGEDYVGALFLRNMPELERRYKAYARRQTKAVNHLQGLSRSQALQAYLDYAQAFTSNVASSWDLSSALGKPVHRLFKYSLLLSGIIDETPDHHPDKDNLRAAKVRVAELSQYVNEERKRLKIVKDVLEGKEEDKKNVRADLTTFLNLSRVKSLRNGGVTTEKMRVLHFTKGSVSEAAQVDAMHTELSRIELFVQQFAKHIVDWGKMMANVMFALRSWALSFGKALGFSADQNSEGFDAFLEVINKGLLPLTADLEAVINERLLKDMAHLLRMNNQPRKLLACMKEQEPYHHHLLAMYASAKNRPPSLGLLAASTKYVALQSQLAAELPKYLARLQEGCCVFIKKLAYLQANLWLDVKRRWEELWLMLAGEEELPMTAGRELTVVNWLARWVDADEVIQNLIICRSDQLEVRSERNMDQKVSQEKEQKSNSKVPGPLRDTDTLPFERSSKTKLPSNISGASTYSVSSPMPLGSITSPSDNRRGDSSRDAIRKRGRGSGVTSVSSSTTPVASTSKLPEDTDLYTRTVSLPWRESLDRSQPFDPSQESSWASKPVKYVCQVVHPCRPPAQIRYFSFPFFRLQVGDHYGILQEAGHPKTHPKLPLYVDDGEECLLLCRDSKGVVGWALASFLMPVMTDV